MGAESRLWNLSTAFRTEFKGRLQAIRTLVTGSAGFDTQIIMPHGLRWHAVPFVIIPPLLMFLSFEPFKKIFQKIQ
jgi:hypothetical protein